MVPTRLLAAVGLVRLITVVMALEPARKLVFMVLELRVDSEVLEPVVKAEVFARKQLVFVKVPEPYIKQARKPVVVALKPAR